MDRCQSRERDVYCDVIKGIAIFLVVFGHCIQFGSGLTYLGEARYFEDNVFVIIYSFHMALLMLISGYFFGHTVQKYLPKQIVITRFTQLLLPLIVWTTITTLIFGGVSLKENGVVGIVNKLIRSYTTEMWFIWAVFWCSLITLAIRCWGNDKKYFHILIIIVLLFIVKGNYTQSYLYMYPYFVAGYLWRQKKKEISNRYILIGITLTIYIVLIQFYSYNCFIYTTGTYLNMENFSGQLFIDIYRWVIGFAGSALVLLTVRVLMDWKPAIGIWIFLAQLGKKSLGIYIISSYINVLLLMKLTSSFSPSHLTNLVEAIIIMVICYYLTKLLEQNKWVRKLFLGGRG